MNSNSILLGDLSNSRNNNFDVIRFLAAVIVVFSHSFPLSLGDNQKEWLSNITEGQATLGYISVFTFLIISGYLITQSYDRTKNILKYTQARILRIIPGLTVLILLTTFLLGPVFTELSLSQYLASKDTYRYLRAILVFKMPYTLPGVFSRNPYPYTVNGSLWTLVCEAKCYIIIGGLGVLNLLKKKVIMFLFMVILIWFNVHNSDTLFMFVCFFAGSAYYMFRNKIKICFQYFIISLVLLLTAGIFGLLKEAFPILGGYIVLYLAFNQWIKLYNFNKHGDFSYGIYIYAFPIQQVIVYLSNYTINPYLLFLISMPLILVFSILSWHLIEKQCLKLRNIRVFDKSSINTAKPS